MNSMHRTKSWKNAWKRGWKQQTAAVVAAAVLLAGLPMGTPRAEAGLFDLGQIIGDVAGGVAKASAIRQQYLAWGNNPAVQNDSHAYCMQQADEGEPDPQAVALVDDVMTYLVDHGNYVRKNDSLPFRWEVIHKNEFNAFCNFADYVCVYDELVRACGYNRDMVAGVLGHEMAHGYNQHIARGAQKKALGAIFANEALSVASAYSYGIGMELPEALANFLLVKNTSVADEGHADESGFYTMASAGFNPGGMPAMVARMMYYTSHADQFTDFFFPNDHPASDVRRTRAAKLMTAYGIGHPTCGNDENTMGNVYFDKKLLLRAEPEGSLDAEEMSYLIAGGIAKGFHDHKTFTEWAFRTDAQGGVDFLDDDNAYAPLKRALRTNDLGTEFQTLVEQAYIADAKSGARAKFLKDEEKHNKDVENERAKQAKAADESPKKVTNGNMYMQLGLTDLAEKEYQRASSLDGKNPDAKSGMAMVLSRRGDHNGAMALANEAIAMAPDRGAGYVARAEVYCDLGDYDAALADCNNALSAKTVDVVAYRVAGDIFDQQGAASSALEEYRAYIQSVPQARDIPQQYLVELGLQ